MKTSKGCTLLCCTCATRSSSTQATREGAKPKESCLRRWSAIAFLLTQPRDDQTIYTTKYLGATHEIFVWSLFICWTVSLIFTPEMVFNHPAREATWHFNPCFGWDFPPASYIAVILNSTNVYWTWRYAWLETTRSAMLPETGLQAWAERLRQRAAAEHRRLARSIGLRELLEVLA